MFGDLEAYIRQSSSNHQKTLQIPDDWKIMNDLKKALWYLMSKRLKIMKTGSEHLNTVLTVFQQQQ